MDNNQINPHNTPDLIEEKKHPSNQPEPRRRGLGVLLVAIGLVLLAAWHLPSFITPKNTVSIMGTFASGGDLYIHEENLPAFDRVEIVTTFAGIEFIPSNGYSVEISLPEESNPDWQVQNGKLTIRELKQVTLAGVNYNIGKRYFVKVYYPDNVRFDDIQLRANSGHITFPEAEVRSLHIHTTSGNINAKPQSYADTAMQSSSGNITFEGGSQGAQASFKASSGSIKAVLAHAAYGVFDTSSGNITADIDGSHTVRATASSGNIDISNDGTPATLYANTTSGDITLDGKAWTHMEAAANSGNINISGGLLGGTSVKATSGDIQLKIHGHAADYGYHLRANSGNLRWDGDRLDAPAHSVGTHENTITGSTTSGNITVTFK